MLSGLAAEKKMGTFKDTLSLSLVRSFLMLPAAIGLIVLREPIVKILFEGQKLHRNTALTAYALFFYSMALFAHAAI